MKTAEIIKAFIAMWKNDTTLAAIPLRSTRLEQGAANPYAVITCKHQSHEMNVGTNYVARYQVNIKIVGTDLATQSGLSSLVSKTFDFSSPFVARADLLHCIPMEEEFELEALDIYGTDIILANNNWEVALGEYNYN